VETASTQKEDKFIADKFRCLSCFQEVPASPCLRLHEANCPKESTWKSMNGSSPYWWFQPLTCVLTMLLSTLVSAQTLNKLLCHQGGEADKFHDCASAGAQPQQHQVPTNRPTWHSTEPSTLSLNDTTRKYVVKIVTHVKSFCSVSGLV
jgi:hypothetical protein